MRAPALKHPTHDGAVVRRFHLNGVTILNPFSIDQKSVGRNIREGHLCHGTIVDLHPGALRFLIIGLRPASWRATPR